MSTEHRELITAEIREIDRQLALPDAVRIQALIEGPKSMARLTDANLRAFEAHVDRLADPYFAEMIINDPFGDPHRLFVEQMQHLAANYFLSAVPLLEHLERHVRKHYPDEAHPTRGQYRLGLDGSVRTYDGHSVVVQLRHMVAHRQLPTVRLVRSPHLEQPVAPTIDRREILADDRCRGQVRDVLESLPTDDLSLDGLIRDDGHEVTRFVDWFFRVQALHHSEEIVPIWRLRLKRDELARSLSTY